MTIEKIIKALRRGLFSNILLQSAADTIEKLDRENNRQKTEIDFLKSSKNLHEAEFKALKTKLDLARAFHKEAIAERDLLNIQLIKASADIERLKKLLDDEEKRNTENAKRFYKVGIKDFAHTFTERFIVILNLNQEQANVAKECKEVLIKEMVGEG